GGLGTLLPIMRVFLNGDTIQTWADRAIAQKRIGVTFADQTEDLQIVRVEPGGAASKAGLEKGDILGFPGPAEGRANFSTMLERLSDPALRSASIEARNRGTK